MNKRVLLIAFHFPPFRSSSGIQRTLSFSRYLPEYGWQPLVLTAHPRAYEQTSDDQLSDIPEDLVVRRAFALDARRHFSIAGRYPEFMALPDRWASWYVGALVAGLKLVRQYRPRVIWSTYPIATAHLIGLGLQKLTGLPFVADFRDSMTDAVYPVPGRGRSVFQFIEKKVLKDCSRAVFTTRGAEIMYKSRYPDLIADKFAVIANGFDDQVLARVKSRKGVRNQETNNPLTLLHSGSLYPLERDPSHFLDAVAELKAEGKIQVGGVRIILRATGHDAFYRKRIEVLGLEKLVLLEPGIGYDDAISEMLNADGLLILQAANCNHQIPAKIYEYLCTKKPILALTDKDGDTASVLKEAGVGLVSPLDDKHRIKSALIEFLGIIRKGEWHPASEGMICSFSRRNRSQELAGLLDDLVGE